jgi:O-antigen/teichoic acid export membrane protein
MKLKKSLENQFRGWLPKEPKLPTNYIRAYKTENTSSVSEIRVRYSGLILFVAQMISVGTGLAFTLLLMRYTTPQAFADWSLIYQFIGPYLFATTILPFWTTRFVARKNPGTVKTGIVANFVIGAIAAGAYLLLFPLYFSKLNVNPEFFDIYLFGALLILSSHLIIMLESCLRSVRPQATGYGLLIQEAIKVAVAYSVLYLYVNRSVIPIANPHILYFGALAGLLISVFVQIGYYLYLLRDFLKEKIQLSYLKEWIKGSSIFIYSTIGGQITVLQYYMIVIANHDSFAYYSAGAMFINVVGYAASLSFALYPKLLSEECSDKHVTTIFSTMMMMAIPLATIAIVMSQSLLTVLNVAYINAWPVMIMMIVATILSLVGTFYSNFLTGTENFDITGKISLKLLVKSKIFKVLTLSYLQAGIIVPSTFVALKFLPVTDPIRVAEYIAAISIIVAVVYLIVIYWLVYKYAGKIFINIKEVSKYLAVAVVTGVVLFLLPTTSTLTFTLLKAFLGMGIYLGLLVLIDVQARILLRLIITEMKQILGFKAKKPECDGQS